MISDYARLKCYWWQGDVRKVRLQIRSMKVMATESEMGKLRSRWRILGRFPPSWPIALHWAFKAAVTV